MFGRSSGRWPAVVLMLLVPILLACSVGLAADNCTAESRCEASLNGHADVAGASAEDYFVQCRNGVCFAPARSPIRSTAKLTVATVRTATAAVCTASRAAVSRHASGGGPVRNFLANRREARQSRRGCG